MFAQPVFQVLENWVKQKFGRAADKLIAVRVILRSSTVVATAGLAMLLPFFSDLMGLIGAIAFTPITFVLPAIFWLKVTLSYIQMAAVMCLPFICSSVSMTRQSHADTCCSEITKCCSLCQMFDGMHLHDELNSADSGILTLHLAHPLPDTSCP